MILGGVDTPDPLADLSADATPIFMYIYRNIMLAKCMPRPTQINTGWNFYIIFKCVQI